MCFIINLICINDEGLLLPLIIESKSMAARWQKGATYQKESAYVEVSNYLCTYEDDYR